MGYQQKRHWDEAISEFSKAIEINPHYAEAYDSRGMCYEHKGHTKHALFDFAGTIRTNTDAFSSKIMNFPKIAASILFPVLFVPPVALYQTRGDQSSTSDRSSRVPDWVPIYPGTSPEQISSRDAGIEHYFNFKMRTRDSCHKVVDWYENKLHAAGYNTFARFPYDSPACNDEFQSDGPGRTRSIMVRANENQAMNVVIISIQAVERSIGNAAKATVPNWVPIYPGTTPGHMQARKSHDEYHLAFSFTSRDDPNKVYSWYKTKLGAQGFRVRFDVLPRSGGLVSNNSDNSRTFNMRNYPGQSENTFTVELMQRPTR